MKPISDGHERCSRRRAGFTRWEATALLVGVMLVGLAGLPLPHGSATARRVQCLANLRAIAGATVVYAGDNGDRMPYPGWGGGLTGPDGWAYATRLNGVPAPSLAARESNALQLPYLRAGQLWPILRSDAVFMCPQDVAASSRESTARNLWLVREVKVTSFTMNSVVIRSGQLPAGRTFSLGRFRPDGILYWEADEFSPFYFNDSGSQPLESPTGRHGITGGRGANPALALGGGHVASADGSAEYLRRGDFYGMANSLPGPNRVWCEPGSPTGGK